MQAGADGLAAGEIARRVGIAPNTLSASLTILAHAGLVGSKRAGRSIIYRADYARMAELMSFLLQDCCNGSPEVCAALAGSVSGAICCALDNTPALEEMA